MTGVKLPKGYKPSADEPFMNDMQKEYFRQKLLAWRAELLANSEETLNNLKTGGMTVPDISDRASDEADKALELRTRDRMRKVISKINEALHRIDDGTYGVCTSCGQLIRKPRLINQPFVLTCMECQSAMERGEQ